MGEDKNRQIEHAKGTLLDKMSDEHRRFLLGQDDDGQEIPWTKMEKIPADERRELEPCPLPAAKNLRECQTQLDADGCQVGVSRQAVDEVLAELDRLHNLRTPPTGYVMVPVEDLREAIEKAHFMYASRPVFDRLRAMLAEASEKE